MYDPRSSVDTYGLSADSLRGQSSEDMIRPDLVGNESVKNPVDPSRNFSRAPLSYHEAQTLLLRGRDVSDETIAPEVADFLASEKERTPASRNEVQMQTLPAIQDKDYQAWLDEKKRRASEEDKEFQEWKRQQTEGRTAPSLADVTSAQTPERTMGAPLYETNPPPSDQQLYSGAPQPPYTVNPSQTPNSGV